jgi:hypothetical protein
MKSVALEPVSWNLRRWSFFLALVFASQLILIYLLSARGRNFLHPQPAHASVQLFTRPLSQSEFTETFLAGDPTLFAVANSHGFSGGAWLKNPERNYDLSERVVESPFWLKLDFDQLGKGLAQFSQADAIVPFSSLEFPEPKILAALILDSTSVAKSNSLLRVEGDLISRQPMAWPELKSWPYTEILSNSVAQIAVDKSGAVVLARLLSRSGLAEADRAALDIARNFSFAPDKARDIVEGNLIFEWHTIPAAVTNRTSGIKSQTTNSPTP